MGEDDRGGCVKAVDEVGGRCDESSWEALYVLLILLKSLLFMI